MIDAVLTVKVPPVIRRALKIYCAAENKTEKDVVTGALNNVVPPGYVNQAAQLIDAESQGGQDAPK